MVLYSPLTECVGRRFLWKVRMTPDRAMSAYCNNCHTYTAINIDDEHMVQYAEKELERVVEGNTKARHFSLEEFYNIGRSKKMTYNEKVEKAKKELATLVTDRKQSGWVVSFTFLYFGNGLFPNFECSLYMDSRTLLGRSNRSENDKYSSDIGKCVAIHHALGIELPSWLRESPVEEKKYKYVFNAKKYMDWCIKHTRVPCDYSQIDFNDIKRVGDGFREMICDKVEVEE